MSRHLERALAHVQKGACEEALDCLIEAWRIKRAPEIAEAVARVDEMLEASPGAAAEAWPAAAKRAKDAAARGPLLRAIGGFTMAQILEALSVVRGWEDPRVGTVLMALLRELGSVESAPDVLA